MHYPDFFNKVPSITLQDPLSDILGAFEEGVIEIQYLECVKLAGHSCPTVAGAYLMAIQGLKALYGDDIPQRGSIEIAMREQESDGVTGVICNVLSFITGANGAGGFKGLNGKFARNGLVTYHADIPSEVQLRRTDTGASVGLNYNASMIPADPMMQPLMGKLLQGLATPEEKKQFGSLWQARVEKILLSTELWDSMVTITKG